MASRRVPLRYLVVSTAAAFVAATGVLLALGDDTSSGGADGAADESGHDHSDHEHDELVAVPGLPSDVPEVALVALDAGPDRQLGEFLGERPVVLNIFASWCAPCIDEMPAVEAVHQDLGDEVTFLGLANRDEPHRAREIVEDTGVTYPTFSDPQSSAFTFFGGINMPTTVFIQPDGDVAEVLSRTMSEDDLRQRIADHFGVTQ